MYYEKKLKSVLHVIFEAAGAKGFSLAGLANAAGLVPTTVWRLANGQTKLPRLRTVWAMAGAVGLEITLEVRADLARRKAG